MTRAEELSTFHPSSALPAASSALPANHILERSGSERRSQPHEDALTWFEINIVWEWDKFWCSPCPHPSLWIAIVRLRRTWEMLDKFQIPSWQRRRLASKLANCRTCLQSGLKWWMKGSIRRRRKWNSRPTKRSARISVEKGVSIDNCGRLNAQTNRCESSHDLLWKALFPNPIVIRRFEMHETAIVAENLVKWMQPPMLHRYYCCVPFTRHFTNYFTR